MPLRPCLELGCPELVPKGRCREHAAGHAARRIGKGVYNDARWQHARRAAIERAGGRCQALERGLRCPVTSGLHGHHAYEGGVEQMLRDGADPFDLHWIVVLCQRHHGQLEAWLRARNHSLRR